MWFEVWSGKNLHNLFDSKLLTLIKIPGYLSNKFLYLKHISGKKVVNIFSRSSIQCDSHHPECVHLPECEKARGGWKIKDNFFLILLIFFIFILMLWIRLPPHSQLLNFFFSNGIQVSGQEWTYEYVWRIDFAQNPISYPGTFLCITINPFLSPYAFCVLIFCITAPFFLS